MAEDDEQTEAGAPGMDRKKLLWLVGIATVLVLLSVGGTLLALSLLTKPGPEEAGAEVAETADADVRKPAIYYPLKPTIIVNFNARGRQRFLQAEVSLMARDNDVVAAIEEHSVKLQHGLLMLFGGQDYNELQTPEGKELLRQQALAEVRRLLEQEIGKPGVEQVLFTNLVMQ